MNDNPANLLPARMVNEFASLAFVSLAFVSVGRKSMST